jgi:pyruvate/2-oxoglutarate dehydrogenase complex dihydrolipoamide acyltransferase (E2) component
VSEAETMMSYARVTAPFDGVVTRKLADVGDLAMPGKPLLEIEAPTALRFEADLPEAILDRIQMGAKMRVKIASVAKALEAMVSEIAPVADPVGAGAVPSHADEEWAVVAVVGWPPLLRVGHRGADVRLQRFEVKLLELFGVVEVRAHRVGLRRVVAQNAEIKLVRPPVVVRSAAGRA